MNTSRLAIITGLIATVLILIAGYATWYNWSIDSDSNETEIDYNYKLQNVEVKVQNDTHSYSSDFHYDNDEEWQVFETDILPGFHMEEFREVMEITFFLWILSLILAISFLLSIFTGLRRHSLKPVMIIGIITCLLSFAAPLYIMLEVPAALERDFKGTDFEGQLWTNDFFGSKKLEGGEFTWGGDLGWYLMLTAGLLNTICVICIARLRQSGYSDNSKDTPYYHQTHYPNYHDNYHYSNDYLPPPPPPRFNETIVENVEIVDSPSTAPSNVIDESRIPGTISDNKIEPSEPHIGKCPMCKTKMKINKSDRPFMFTCIHCDTKLLLR